MLSRRATSIVQVVEGTTTLDATDYELKDDGQLLRRLSFGATHPRSRWWHRVDVTYVPVDDLANRKRVQIALVALDLNHDPGASQETIGSWSESHSQGAGWNYETERRAILDSLSPAGAGIW